MTPKQYFGAARAFTDVALGGPTNDVDSTFTVQTTVGVVLQGNPDRVGLLIINLGNNDVFLGLTSGVSTSAGAKLPALGGNFIANVRDDFTLPSRTYYGLANGGTSAIYIIEILRQQYAPAGE